MTNYFSFQHFRKMNVRFMLLKKIPLCMKLSVIMLGDYIQLYTTTKK